MQILKEHGWPGNVRELENVVERAVVLATQPTVTVDVLPEYLLQAGESACDGMKAKACRPTPRCSRSWPNTSATSSRSASRPPIGARPTRGRPASAALHAEQKIKRLNIEVRRKSTWPKPRRAVDW